MTAGQQHVAIGQTARDDPNPHGFRPAQVEPDDPRGLDGRVDCESRRQAFHVADDAMSVRAEQAGELDAALILAQPVFNGLQPAIRPGGRDGITFLGDRGIHPQLHIGRRLPIDEGREQQDADDERNGSPAEGRGTDEIRKVHEE